MDLGLRGRVAFVAASSKGLGRAIAEELAAEGADLFLCSRGAEALEQAKRQLGEAHGVRVEALPADVAKEDEIRNIVREATSRLGRIDILVTNAGGPPSGKFESLSPAMWNAAVGLTLMSVVNLTREVLPGMKERRWGRVINVTSIAVKQPVEDLMLSNSLRAAVTGFAKTLANEVAPFGITVNNILPGYTRTERVEQLSKALANREGISREDAMARWESEIPMRRLGEPREFAALAAFLASDRAGYLTGASIPVDGGWIKGLL
ncbi:MAG TPA: SDR family oxidoreductase [Gemmatimonadaceae bacterium]|nr:SDR family oxidoreductase [Gemmatimonadaceae bacterium]